MSPQLVLLAHNIRSLWNVGSLFRTSDAFGVSTIIFTGYTPVPPRREISKTAIGADEWIAWEQATDPLAVIKQYQTDGYQAVGLELDEKAVQLKNYVPTDKVLLVLGHEVLGISVEMRQACDTLVEIPMHGQKESINVAVAAGIALNKMRNG